MATDTTDRDDPMSSNYSVLASQPEYLATIATLRGLHPADVERARVLELGCASGRNLLPLADRYPQGEFVGIDRHPRQIALARQTMTDLQLRNVDFREQDLSDVGTELGTFDYIIAHGMYSWIDRLARDKLLAICAVHLAPQGVAYVSYNVYPGWHVHDMLRAMMLYQARGVQGVVERAARGRLLLEFLKASLDPRDAPYNGLIAAEVDPLLKQTDANLRQDLWGEVNSPVYFQEFIAHAKSHRLQFLGDGTQGIRYADPLSPGIEKDLEGATTDPLQKIQYRDILRKKTFRQTLLCHAEIEVRQTPTPESIRNLFVEARIRAENPKLNLRSTNVERFIGANDASVATAAPIIKAALLHLGEIWPACLRFDELVSAAQSRIEEFTGPASTASPADIQRLENNLMECCSGGILEVHVKPQSFTSAVSQRPAASPLARWQAARGDVVTNRRHVPIRLETFDRQVLQMLDGSRDRTELVNQLVEWTSQGRIGVSERQEVVQSADRARQLLDLELTQVLTRLANHSFLVG